MFFRCFSTLSRSSRPTCLKKRRLMKNLQKPVVFTGFSHVPSFARVLKIDRKSLRRRFSNASCVRARSKNAFSSLSSIKMVPEGPPGRSWAALGKFLGALGALFGALGPLLGYSWDALGRLLAALGLFWKPLRDPGSNFAFRRSILDAFGG